uniref:Liver-expressed antimicrobial peptide 2 n=1 Tax=Fundulus heteroclitus TaxID=8078 RepID=A0A3Q2UQ60_FUNHE
KNFLLFLALFLFLGQYLLLQVNTLPVPDDWNGLIQRTKRSLLWRLNSLKPVGASCRDPSECGTKHCRKNICSF